MRRHARTILAPAFATVLTLCVLAGAEPAEPKADRLTVEGLADGKVVIRHNAAVGKSSELKIQRLANGRFQLEGHGESPIVCGRFRLEDRGQVDCFDGVEMTSKSGFSIKADSLFFSLYHDRPRAIPSPKP